MPGGSIFHSLERPGCDLLCHLSSQHGTGALRYTDAMPAKRKKTVSRGKSTTKTPPAASTSAGKTDWTLHIISDATGNLARHMITPMLTQFPTLNVEKVFHPFCNTLEKVEETIKAIKPSHTIVLHALVNADAKRLVRLMCIPRRLPQYDLTGGLALFLAEHFGTLPAEQISRLHQVDAAYFRRIDAMEFTAIHDDSQALDTIDRADVVIVGLSRVSKSPTSTFLASLGYKVANVSITPETGLPKQLNAVKKKTIALTVQPKHLQQVRAARLPEVQDTPYHDLREVIREVVWAEDEYRKRKYPILDITGMTIEQVAARIVEAMKLSE